MRLTTIVLAMLAAIGVTAPAHAIIITKKECKPIQATCKPAAACIAGTTPSGACTCNNSCNCTGRINCMLNGVVIEHHDCEGDCIKTVVQSANPNETPTETACATESEDDKSLDSGDAQRPASEPTIKPEPTQSGVAESPTP